MSWIYNMFAWTWTLSGWGFVLWRIFIAAMAVAMIVGFGLFLVLISDEESPWRRIIFKSLVCHGTPWICIFVVGFIGYLVH